MRPKHIFAILLASALALVGVLFLRAVPLTSVAAVTPPPPPVEEILVAARPLPSGLLLRSQDVIWLARSGAAQPGEIVRPPAAAHATKPESAEVPRAGLHGVTARPAEDDAAKHDGDEAARATVYGAVLRINLAEAQPIRTVDIVRPGDRDFLHAVLTEGTRALTIPVSGTGGSGLMFPGDHVDVMLTQTFKNDAAPLTRRSVSETVVDNLRVLAIETNAKAPAQALTVTLEVRPQQAEKVNVAQELGKLSLTLRSLTEAPVATAAPATPLPPTWAGDVSPALNSAVPPAQVIQAEKPGIKVMRGNASVETKAQ